LPIFALNLAILSYSSPLHIIDGHGIFLYKNIYDIVHPLASAGWGKNGTIAKLWTVGLRGQSYPDP
jgi:hypothetical protein